MAMQGGDPMSRKIALQLTHQGGQAIALPALVRTLGALQKVLLQVGEMHHTLRPATEEQTGRSRGRFPNVIKKACELQVIRLETGSVTAFLELPPPELTLPLLQEEDLGMQALATTMDLTRELANGASWERVHELLPVDAYRDLILDSYRGLCPTRDERAVVSLWDPETPDSVCRLGSQVRVQVQVLRAQATPEDVTQERQFIGRINVLQADPPRFTLVLGHGRSLPVPFDAERAEEYRPLWGELVIASTICRVIPHSDGDDTVVEIRDVVEINPVDDGPLELTAIPLIDGSLPLREPLSVPPDFSDNLVTFGYEPLGILAYGKTRDEAEQAFSDELEWLWLSYANAPDEELAPDAIGMKQRLHRMVGEGVA